MNRFDRNEFLTPANIINIIKYKMEQQHAL